jgi:hypothetical protein
MGAREIAPGHFADTEMMDMRRRLGVDRGFTRTMPCRAKPQLAKRDCTVVVRHRDFPD